jgi:hypothetical protein
MALAIINGVISENDRLFPHGSAIDYMKKKLAVSTAIAFRLHDCRRTATTGMARLGVAPHVADRILNHQSGTISGVAAIYNRFSYIEQRRAALDLWGSFVRELVQRRDGSLLKSTATSPLKITPPADAPIPRMILRRPER